MRSVRPRRRSLETARFPSSKGKKSRFGEAKVLHHNGLARQTFCGFDPHTPVLEVWIRAPEKPDGFIAL